VVRCDYACMRACVVVAVDSSLHQSDSPQCGLHRRLYLDEHDPFILPVVGSLMVGAALACGSSSKVGLDLACLTGCHESTDACVQTRRWLVGNSRGLHISSRLR
jgi:hypothetical protein